MTSDLLTGLAVSLAIGLVVGLERGWRLRDEPDGSRVAGLRTFGLAGLLGGAAGALAMALDEPLIFAAVLVAFAAIFAWYQSRDSELRHSYSVTSVIAAIAVVVLGGLAVTGAWTAAGAGGVAVACLLASRDVLHALLRRLTWPEVRSALLLLVMSVIVLPMLPDRTIDPWGGVNPSQIWLFTVLTAAISFAGYVAIRIVGPARGTLVASFLGGLVSSTAVTAALGRRARVEGAAPQLIGGAAVAAMVSVLRVVVLVLLLAPALVPLIVLPALLGAVVFGVAGFLFLRGPVGPEAQPAAGNPFDIAPLAIFAGAFTIVSLISAAASTYLGPSSVIATSGVSAILDVDVATLSVARLAGDGVPLTTAAQAILVALAANGVGRVIVAMVAGPPRYWQSLAGVLAAAILTGTVAATIVGPF
ncbi:MAG: MgtC/SapB family protein [Chitinophagaceae bacterium]|nr:MgtC/SapB family protein [Chitinophagaceae bacterium]